MKTILRNLKEGILKLKIEDLDDLGYLSRIIKAGDIVSGSSTRKIKIGDKSVRKKAFLKIEVEKVNLEGKNLRINGKILASNSEDIPIGNYQSIPVEPGVVIEIKKENWLKHELEEIEEAGSKPYKILVCAFNREEAIFILISKRGYEILSKIKGQVRKKDYEVKVSKSFFKEIAENIYAYEEKLRPDSIILASQGFWKDYLLKEIEEGPNPEIKSKLIVSTCNSVDETSIKEILRRPETKTALKKTRISFESAIVDRVLKAIAKNSKVAYGIEEVKKASDYKAINTLIISSSFLDKHYALFDELSKKAEKEDFRVIIIDSDFEPGKNIDSLGGISALLRFDIN